MIRKHLVISGTGRTGTTFLVELFTALGFDTGVGTVGLTSKKLIANAGLEYDIRKEDAPYVVKSPALCDYIQEVLDRNDIHLEHVIIPMRNLFEAAESRRQVSELNERSIPLIKRIKLSIRKLLLNQNPKPHSGGLWSTTKGNDQEIVLLKKFYDLLLALSASEIPVTLINYPQHLTDSRYLYNKLIPVLNGIDFAYFDKVHRDTVKRELIHTYADQN